MEGRTVVLTLYGACSNLEIGETMRAVLTQGVPEEVFASPEFEAVFGTGTPGEEAEN